MRRGQLARDLNQASLDAKSRVIPRANAPGRRPRGHTQPPYGRPGGDLGEGGGPAVRRAVFFKNRSSDVTSGRGLCALMGQGYQSTGIDSQFQGPGPRPC